jgi:hypothetical protein
VLVCFFLFCSFFKETLLTLMESRSTIAPSAAPADDATTGLLIFYYVALGFFLLVCLFLLGSFFFRALFEHGVLREGRAVENGQFSAICSVKVLQFALWTAFSLLAGLFLAYWIFWGRLLEMLSFRMQIVILRLSVKEVTRKALAAAANRTFVVVVTFVMSVSLNVLVLMRHLVNKTVLLKSNRRSSLFRLEHVNLTELSSSRIVFRQLWISFLFDVAELWTLASWSL